MSHMDFDSLGKIHFACIGKIDIAMNTYFHQLKCTDQHKLSISMKYQHMFGMDMNMADIFHC